VVATLTAGKAGGQPIYRCRDHDHLGRAARHLDGFVGEVVIGRLSRPDAIGLFTRPAPDVDVAALRAERAAIGRRLAAMAEDEVLGLKTREQVIAATRTGRARVQAIDVELAGAVVAESPAERLARAEDVRAAWEALPLPERRTVVQTLMVVTVLRSGRSGRGFNPDSVQIEWC
jgi:hypothetical protein